MFSIQVFTPTDTEVRSFIEQETNICWFHAGGLSEALEFSNPYRYLPSILMDGEFKEISFGAGRPAMYVREEGVYKLIMKSKSPYAEGFQHWLAYDVLPAIRKTGSFGNVPNHKSEGGEFWQLIDGAIARNMEPERAIDLHHRFNQLEQRTTPATQVKPQKQINSVEEFVQAHIKVDNTAKPIDKRFVYEKYQWFCKSNRLSPISFAKFCLSMKTLLGEEQETKRTSRMVKGQKVNVPARFQRISFC